MRRGLLFELALLSILMGCSAPPVTTSEADRDTARVLEACMYSALDPSSGSEDFDAHENCAWFDDAGLHLDAEHLRAATEGSIGPVSLLVDGRWFYLRSDGSNLEVIAFDNGPDYFSDGLARIRKDGKIGYANESFELVIEPAYEWGWPFENGVALVCSGCGEHRSPGEEHTSIEGGSWGAIDASGELVVEMQSSREAVYSELAARVAPTEDS